MDADVVVLGAGSGGEAVVRAVAGDGRSVVVVEEGLVGGECPFTACMPSKAVLHAAARGWSWERARSHRDDVIDGGDDSSHVAELEDNGATLLRGRGEVTGPGRLRVVGDGGEHEVRWSQLVIATGAGLSLPDVDGLETVDWWDSHDLWTADTFPASLLVLGGGPVGLEIATAGARYAEAVTVVDRGSELVDGFPEADEVLLPTLRTRGVTVHQEAEVAAVARQPDGAVLARLADGTEVTAERLVLATGKRPRLHGLGLESLGITPDQFEVDRRGRVAGVDGVWAVGDVTGFPAFTHTANHVGAAVGANLLGGDQEADLEHTPKGMFTDPPVVVVGDVTPADDRVRVTVSYDDGARPQTDRTGPGTLVLQCRRDGTVTGVAGAGATVDELASAWTLMVGMGLSVHDVARVQQQFPSHGELTKLLAERAVDALG